MFQIVNMKSPEFTVSLFEATLEAYLTQVKNTDFRWSRLKISEISVRVDERYATKNICVFWRLNRSD